MKTEIENETKSEHSLAFCVEIFKGLTVGMGPDIDAQYIVKTLHDLVECLLACDECTMETAKDFLRQCFSLMDQKTRTKVIKKMKMSATKGESNE